MISIFNTMKTGVRSIQYIIPSIVAFFCFSCESYLRWDIPEVVKIDEYVSTCDDSYEWIDGIIYYPDDSIATFLITGQDQDTLITLYLSWGALTGTDEIVACNSYTWIDGISYTTSNNVATHTLNSPSGCDSVVTLDLTINHSKSEVDEIRTCSEVVWIDGNTYAQNNNSASVLLTTSKGCDSLVTLNLIMDCQCSTSPNSICGITTLTNGQNYTIGISGTSFTPGQNIVVNMNSSSYSFGQAKNVSLFCNETVVSNFGSWLYFSGNSRSFTIPSSIKSDHCYTIRVSKEGSSVSAADDDIYVSSKFSIQ